MKLCRLAPHLFCASQGKNVGHLERIDVPAAVVAPIGLPEATVLPFGPAPPARSLMNPKGLWSRGRQ